MTTVAILGLGKMGAAMARELVAAGHQVIGWNRSTDVSEKLATDLASQLFSVATSAASALESADIALALFTNGDVTEQVFLSDPATLAQSNPAIIIMDMGTSGVKTALALKAGINKVGRRFIDAPVSGSMATIASHQLLVMAGGDESDIETVRPTLAAFAKKVAHVGDAGAGQTMKLSVNLIVHSLNAAVSESLSLATSFGIDPTSAYEIFEESVIAAPFVKYKKAAFLDSATPVAMRVDTVVKDMGLIVDFAKAQGLSLQAGESVAKLYQAAAQGGFAEADMSALARFITKK